MIRATLIAARRTPVAPRGGALARLLPHELAAHAARACLADAGLLPSDVNELILANALGAGGNPARLAALAAGLPQSVGGLTLDRQCTGGLDALTLAAALVETGRAEVVLAGGAESFSRRPLRLATSPDGHAPQPYLRPAFAPPPFADPDMAAAADALALPRAEQDSFAIASHTKARAADLSAEIAPLSGCTADTYPRRLTAATTARAPALHGNVTAANTAPEADAAALCLVTTPAIAQRLNRPALEITTTAMLGGDPAQPGVAPIAAIRSVLGQTPPSDLTQIELMEAFAAQAIACINGAALPTALVSPKGGALARGHPIGASGAILATRLYHDLAHQPGSLGLAAIAAAGGLGSAILFTAL